MDYNIYLPNGYVNVRKVIKEYGCCFIYMIGGRGSGKTYNALDYVIQDKIKFVFLRRLAKEFDTIIEPKMNPFKRYNKNNNLNILPFKDSKDTGFFSHAEIDSKNKITPIGQPVGLISSLTGIATVRGFDASDCDCIIYDEFIPEEHKRKIKGEYAALMNAYETINRNRELEGEPPCTMICLANSNNIYNPIFVGLKIVNKLYEMQCKGQEVYINRARRLCVINLEYSPISEKKKDTALYQLTKDTEFYDMAINNKFEIEAFSRRGSRNIKEYKPVCTVGEFTVYEHKSRTELYISVHKSGVCPEFGISSIERLKFKRAFSWIWTAYLNNHCIFENISLEYLLVDYFTEKG